MRLGGRQYAKRYRTAQGRAGAGQQGEDGDSGAGAGGHVGDGHEALALGELDDQLFLLAPAAEGNEGKRGKYLYLPWRNFFAKADTRAMVTRAGSTPVGKALERTHGLSAKIVGYDSNEEYNQATIQVMFKDGGPFSYFLEPPKPENQRRGNENMFLTHPAVYILTGNPCMGLDPEVLRL